MEREKYELVYRINKDGRYLQLLGDIFYKRTNQLFGYFIYNKRRIKLKSKIEIKNIKEKELKLKLIFFKPIYDKSFMFNNCHSLLKVEISHVKDKDISEIENQKEVNLTDLFYHFEDNNQNNDNELSKTLWENKYSFNYSDITFKMKRDSKISTVNKIYNNNKIFKNSGNNPYSFTERMISNYELSKNSSKWNVNKVTNIKCLFLIVFH